MSVGPDIQGAAAYVRGRLSVVPDVVIVLGSGLGHLVEQVEDAVSIPFGDIPGFPETAVVGHAGRYVAGRLGGRDVMLQAVSPPSRPTDASSSRLAGFERSGTRPAWSSTSRPWAKP